VKNQGGGTLSTEPLNGRAEAEDEIRVSTLELFFDLVFVFTLTQLTGLLAEESSIERVAQVVLIFIVLFWMYGGYAWLTNRLAPNRSTRRLLLMLGMAGFLICALAIPEAFHDGGIAFGAGYLLVVLVHAGLYAQIFSMAVVMRFAPLNFVSAFSVIAAGSVDGAPAYALWVLAVLIQFVTPSIAARVGAVFDVRAAHFVERHGLLLIVALGESVVAIGVGLGHVPLDAGVFVAAVLGLSLACALWWTYFVVDAEHAERVMVQASPNRRFHLAINAYFYAYIPILVGVVAAAAGVEESIGHVTETLEAGPALALGGGMALYLIGALAFRRVVGLRPATYRGVAAVVALATIPLGTTLSAAVQMLALVACMVVMLTAEARAQS
jgi:low temperature requirement protein LtrA